MRMRHTLGLSLLLALGIATGAQAGTGYSAVLYGYNENPANLSPAVGFATVILNNAQTQLDYSVTFSGLTAGLTASHIHKGAAFVNGPVIFGFNTTSVAGLTAGTFSGVVTGLTAANVADLQGGLYYVNIHSTAFPGGEIRAQLEPDTTPTEPTTWGRIKALYR